MRAILRAVTLFRASAAVNLLAIRSGSLSRLGHLCPTIRASFLPQRYEAIELQMAKIVATSPAGIIEQVDTLRAQIRSSDEPDREPMLDTIITGLRAIAAKDGEAQP